MEFQLWQIAHLFLWTETSRCLGELLGLFSGLLVGEFFGSRISRRVGELVGIFSGIETYWFVNIIHDNNETFSNDVFSVALLPCLHPCLQFDLDSCGVVVDIKCQDSY